MILIMVMIRKIISISFMEVSDLGGCGGGIGGVVMRLWVTDSGRLVIT